jgi:hypothetical protein
MMSRWLLGLPLLVACSSATSARAQGYPAEEAVRRMTVADGFTVELVASEPLIRQPVAIDFDDRGRLWVLQYLQYPNLSRLILRQSVQMLCGFHRLLTTSPSHRRPRTNRDRRFLDPVQLRCFRAGHKPQCNAAMTSSSLRK